MSSQEMSTVTFILSLIGGILITAGSILSLALFPFDMYDFGGMMGGFWRGMGGMMGGFWAGMMGGYGGYGVGYGGMGGMMRGYWGYPQAVTAAGISYGFVATLAIVGLVAGIMTTIGALMLNARPAEHTTWGAMILIFSIISFLGMGGFFIGAILGIVGGALALIWKPAVKA